MTRLVGQDSGGLIAREVAIRLPNAINGLVLCGTEIPGHHPKLITRLQKLTKIPGAQAITRALLRLPRAARSPQLFGGLFFDRDLIEGTFRDHVLDPLIADAHDFARQVEILSSYQTDLVDRLGDIHPRITCPSLLIWGEHDPFFPVDDARAMTHQFGGPVRFEVIPNARLLAYEEHPARFGELTRSFLGQHQLAGH